MRFRSSTAIFVLIFLGFLIYLPSLFGHFVWDDEDFVYANRFVAEHHFDRFFTENNIAGRGKVSNYYRPIHESVYALIHLGFGYNPFIYHLVNVAVHILAALAIFYFLFLLVKDETVAFFVSLLFLIHPVQTEAVSYISGLSDPLCVLFGFLSLNFFLKLDQHRFYYLLSMIFFVLTLLSKETGIVFLGIIGLIWVLKRKNISWVNLVPFLVITIIYLIFHLVFISQQDIKAAWGNNPYANSLLVRLATFSQNIFTYLSLFFFPKDLFMERDFSIKIQTSLLNPYTFLFFIINSAILGFLYKFRKKIQHFALVLFSFAAFYLTFLPYSGIILINGIVYEHFLYLPLVFLALFIFLLLEKILNKRATLIILVIWLAGLSLRSISRQMEWSDPVGFYEQTLTHAPQSIRIRNGLAMAYADKGDLEKAAEVYQSAIKLDPTVPNLYHNLGNIYLAEKDFDRAQVYYKKAIEADPNFYFSYEALINLYRVNGENANEQTYKNLLRLRFPTLVN